MRAFPGVPEATLVLFVFLISPASMSPHFHNIVNNNRPVALLLPNGKIVRSPNSPEYDPQNINNLKPASPVLKPSKGSICSLVTANFSNQRRKGFAEVQSRVHGINTGVLIRSNGHTPVWSDFTTRPRKLQNYVNRYQPIYHPKNANRCFIHSRSQLHNPDLQFSSIFNKQLSSPKTNGENIDYAEFNLLLSAGPPKCTCKMDENRRKTARCSIENDDGYGHVTSREREMKSLQALGPKIFKTAAGETPTQMLQYENPSRCSGRDCGSMLAFPEGSCPPLLVTSNPTAECVEIHKDPGNPSPSQTETTRLLLDGRKERIGTHGGDAVFQCFPALQIPPENLPRDGPCCVACSNCSPILPWVPRPTTPWFPRMAPPPWTTTCFPRRPCQPWFPETPTIFKPFNVEFANRCSPLGPLVPAVTVTAVTDTALVYSVVLPNVFSSTSAQNFFPPGQLISGIEAPQEFTDLLHIFLIAPLAPEVPLMAVDYFNWNKVQ